MRINGSRPEAANAEQERRLELLATMPELARCTRAELAVVDARGTEVRRPAGTVLQTAGRALRQAAIVLEGGVEDRAGLGARELRGRGHFVGAAGLRGRSTLAETTVVAATAVRLLVFGPDELEDLAAIAGIRAWATGAASAQARVSVSARRPAQAFNPALG